MKLCLQYVLLSHQAPAQSVLPPPPRPQAAAARPSKEARGGMGSRESRLTARNAPDNHQVFIGNLPSGIKDDEVRNVFASEYHKKALKGYCLLDVLSNIFDMQCSLFFSLLTDLPQEIS